MAWTTDALADPNQAPGARAHTEWQQWLNMARRHSTAEFMGRMLLKEASGCWLTMADGTRMLDLIGGYGVVATGWNHPMLVEAMKRAADFMFAPPFLATQQAAELAHQMLEVFAMPEGWVCARATGGGDANEQVLKALGVIAFEGGMQSFRVARYARAYHGGSAAMLALSDAATFGLSRASILDPQPMIPLPTGPEAIAHLNELLDRDPSILAIIIEPVIGSGGVIPIEQSYLRLLRERCDQRGIYLIFDEVITGCGRTGAMLACHTLGFWPDAITLGKGLTSGAAALGAALLSQELGEALRKVQDSSATFAWSPAACAICRCNLEIIESEFLAAKADLLGQQFASQLRAVLDDACPGRFELKSCGMMFGLWPTCEPAHANRLIRKLSINALRRGLLIGASWDWQSAVLLPPLTIGEEECKLACQNLHASLASL